MLSRLKSIARDFGLILLMFVSPGIFTFENQICTLHHRPILTKPHNLHSTRVALFWLGFCLSNLFKFILQPSKPSANFGSSSTPSTAFVAAASPNGAINSFGDASRQQQSTQPGKLQSQPPSWKDEVIDLMSDSSDTETRLPSTPSASTSIDTIPFDTKTRENDFTHASVSRVTVPTATASSAQSNGDDDDAPSTPPPSKRRSKRFSTEHAPSRSSEFELRSVELTLQIVGVPAVWPQPRLTFARGFSPLGRGPVPQRQHHRFLFTVSVFVGVALTHLQLFIRGGGGGGSAVTGARLQLVLLSATIAAAAHSRRQTVHFILQSG